MIQMPPNFHLFANSSTPPAESNTDNTNITNPTSLINNLVYPINSEDSLDDWLSLDYNMSDSNSYGHGYDDLAEHSTQPVFQNYMPVPETFHAPVPLTGAIKNEPSYAEDESPRPITEKVVNKKNGKEQIYLKWGPIKVRPRQRPAPTLASGRKSKNTVLSPEEERKREERRKRNREAAEKCKQNRESVVKDLEKTYDQLLNERDNLLIEHDNLLKEKSKLQQLFNESQAPSAYNQEFGNTYQTQSYTFANVYQYPTYSYQMDHNQYFINPSQAPQQPNVPQTSQSAIQNYQMHPQLQNFDTNQWS